MLEAPLTADSLFHPLWPEARWNLSSLCVHDRYILDLCIVLKERFGANLMIDSVHGAPPVLWNNGRLIQSEYSDEDIQRVVMLFNAMGVGVFYTFSNHLLTEDDLADERCNRLLGYIDNESGLNGVILASELLHEYLRANHPSLKQTASVIKVARVGRGNLDYYLDHAERFESVMVHPDDGFNLEILDKLDRDRMEIMVNENCPYMCQNRARHYDEMPTLQKRWLAGEITKEQTSRCRSLGGFAVRHRSCNFRSEELQTVYDMGFRRFKVQGRLDVVETFAYDTMRFMFDPGVAMPMLYKGFNSGWLSRHAAAIMRNNPGGIR
jgi:hypothetical protein